MNDSPLLTKQDEEFQMLREVARNVTNRITHARERGETLTTGQISGEETEKVVRNHLVSKGFSISRNRVFINPSDIEIDLLLLKDKINPSNKCYSSDQVCMVLEIKNNAVPPRRNKIPIQPSDVIRDNFSKLEEEAKANRFAVVVLSERLLSDTPYKYAITEEKIGKKNCQVFTLVARRKTANHLYDVDVINDLLENNELWKTGEWKELLAHLKE